MERKAPACSNDIHLKNLISISNWTVGSYRWIIELSIIVELQFNLPCNQYITVKRHSYFLLLIWYLYTHGFIKLPCLQATWSNPKRVRVEIHNADFCLFRHFHKFFYTGKLDTSASTKSRHNKKLLPRRNSICGHSRNHRIYLIQLILCPSIGQYFHAYFIV